MLNAAKKKKKKKKNRLQKREFTADGGEFTSYGGEFTWCGKRERDYVGVHVTALRRVVVHHVQDHLEIGERGNSQPTGAEFASYGGDFMADKGHLASCGGEFTADGGHFTSDGEEFTSDGADLTPDSIWGS
jgi:hypothetical protein